MSCSVERVSSAVECRTHNQGPGFESPIATISKFGHFRSLHDAPVHSTVGPINEYLAIDGDGNVSE